MRQVHQLALLFIGAICELTIARHNVTVDDTDVGIRYLPPGAWFTSVNNTLDFGYAHMLTQNGTANATFNFTGVAIYFLSPLWPYLVNTAVSLDSAPIILIDLVDHSRSAAGTGFGPETVQSQVIWSATNLSNAQHTLVISVGESQPYAIVDGLIYTVLDETDYPSSNGPISPFSSSTPLSATSTASITATPPPVLPTSSSSSSSRRGTRIAVGSVLGVLGILIIALFVWFCVRRRKRPLSEAWTIASASKSATSATSPRTTRPSPLSLGPPASYPQQAYPSNYLRPELDQAVWKSPRHGYVGLPAPLIPPAANSATSVHYSGVDDLPELQISEGEEEPYRAQSPARYPHGTTLSTITESSPPNTEGTGSVPSPASSSPVGQSTEASSSSAPSGSPRLPPSSEHISARSSTRQVHRIIVPSAL